MIRQQSEKSISPARRLTLGLLLVWFVATFVLAWFARPLAQLTFFGWPFSFYMAAQGSLLIYLLIIVIFAWRMNRTEAEASSSPQ